MTLARLVSSVCLSLAFWACAPAWAAEPVDFQAETHEGYARLTILYPTDTQPNRIGADAEIAHGVAVVRFARPVSGEPASLPGALGGVVALARMDGDGGALRLALRRDVRLQVTASDHLIAVDFIDPERSADPAPIVSPQAAAAAAAEEEARRRAEAIAATPEPPPLRLPLMVRVAEASDYARIAFDWTEPVGYEVAESDFGAEIRFDRDAAPDLARLRIDPPDGVDTAEARHEEGRLIVALGLWPGYETRHWRDGDRIVVDVTPDATQALAEALAALEPVAAPVVPPGYAERDGEPAIAVDTDADAPAETRVDAHPVITPRPPEADALPPDADAPVERDSPRQTEDVPVADAEDAAAADVPATVEPVQTIPPPEPRRAPILGAIGAEVTPVGRDAHVSFAFDAEVAAAAFRRGDAWWIVFDAEVELDLAELRRGAGRLVRGAEALSGSGYAAARIRTRPEVQLEARPDGARWTFVLGEAISPPSAVIAIERRAPASEPASLFAPLSGAGGVRMVADPEAGDVLLVATASGPAQSVLTGGRFLEVEALPTAHGVAFAPRADGVAARREEGGVLVTRPEGLTLSRQGAGLTGARGAAAAAATPGLIDFQTWSGPAAAFATRHDELARIAATSDAPAEDLLVLARHLLGHELAAETLGAVRELLREDPALANDARVRALRGAARYMMGRVSEASEDFAAPSLGDDPAASLWRALIAAHGQDWREARRQFEHGREALIFYRPDWRARFYAAGAAAAIELGDLAEAGRMIDRGRALGAPQAVALELDLLHARLLAARGETEAARDAAIVVADAGHEPIESRARLAAIALAQELGDITAAEAVSELEALRLRWRGDASEMQVARTLGSLYAEAGAYRTGLSMMRSIVARYPDDPIARQIGGDMAGIFRELYLEDGADALDPVEALALWYEFADLTPVGADGDRMIRRLADRLADFDLLAQAAELLQHQVDHRLRGNARASVAADLAAIYLMDRRPEQALNAIRATRVARLPSALNAERRLLEARALAELDRYEHALELLATDRSSEARRLSADFAWALRDWAEAARLLEAALGEAWRSDAPLAPHDADTVLRAAIASSLAGETEALSRLEARYGARMLDSEHAASWRIVAQADGDAEGARLRDLARRVAAVDTLDAFLADFRARRAATAPLSPEEQAGEG